MSPDPNFKAWPVFKNEHPGHANLMERLDITDAQREELAHLALIQKSHWVAVVGGKDKALAQAQAELEELRWAVGVFETVENNLAWAKGEDRERLAGIFDSLHKPQEGNAKP